MKRADVVKEELLRITAENGGVLKAADVVVAARPEASPLHNQFEWDDSAAAENYRLWQARQLISVTVEYLNTHDPNPVFVSLTVDRKIGGGGYRTLVSVLSDEAQREQLLADALSDAKQFREKYKVLKELARVFAAMEEVESEVVLS
jgi:predicted MarR family transcription regulator